MVDKNETSTNESATSQSATNVSAPATGAGASPLFQAAAVPADEAT
ncbi:MAG: hypothetical protein VXW73_05755 [Actinomycetota bacterium]|nr:hypothetical protein [Actinomycetota bacterium]